MTKADPGRRRVMYFALFLALIFGGIAAWDWWDSREPLRERSDIVSQSGERLEIGKIPKTYRATFRYENRAGGTLRVTTEKFWANRPFASRGETYIGERTTGRPDTVRQSNFGVLASASRGTAEPLNITVPPSLASGDLRIDAILDQAVERKIVLVREQREVYGRRCQVYRAGSSVLAGDIPTYEPRSGEYADVCVDENGIVIEEYWVKDGELLRRRVATELEVGIPIPRSVFRIDVEPSESVSRGAVEKLPSDAPTAGLWTLGRPPDGFERLGRYAVILSPDAVPSIGGQRAPVGPSSTTDVYVRGPDLLVLDQDPGLGVLANLENRPARKVTVPTLRDAELVLDSRQSEVRGKTPDDSFIRVLGTVAPADLLDLAGSAKLAQE